MNLPMFTKHEGTFAPVKTPSAEARFSIRDIPRGDYMWLFIAALATGLLRLKPPFNYTALADWVEVCIYMLFGLLPGILLVGIKHHLRVLSSSNDSVEHIFRNIESQMESTLTLVSRAKYFELLSQGKETKDDKRLARYFVDLVDEHIWRIPNAGAATMYSILADALDRAMDFAAIHPGKLVELINPLDGPNGQGMLYFTKLEKTKIPVRRIIVRTEHDLKRLNDLEPQEKNAIRILAGRRVKSYFFNRNKLNSILANYGHNFPGHTPPPRNVVNEISNGNELWPDCAIYNGRFYVQYERHSKAGVNSNCEGGENSSKGDESNSKGAEICVWPTEMTADLVHGNEESRVNYFSKTVRFLFQYLAELETNRHLKCQNDEFIKIDDNLVKEMGL